MVHHVTPDWIDDYLEREEISPEDYDLTMAEKQTRIDFWVGFWSSDFVKEREPAPLVLEPLELLENLEAEPSKQTPMTPQS